jgi:hypothetical protein
MMIASYSNYGVNTRDITFDGGDGRDDLFINAKQIIRSGDIAFEGNNGDDNIDISSYNVLTIEDFTFDGDAGNDSVSFSSGFVEIKNVIFDGDAGDDFVSIAGNGNKTIDTGIGNDSIELLGGYNLITGGKENDIIKITSISGNDTLNYTNGEGSDTIFGFTKSADVIVFTDILDIDLVTIGTATEIRIGDGIAGNTGFGSGDLLITLKDISVVSLTADNFQDTDFLLS